MARVSATKTAELGGPPSFLICFAVISVVRAVAAATSSIADCDEVRLARCTINTTPKVSVV